MREVVLVRHAQASFGAADYDVLSALGHRQAAALGRALSGERFAAAFTGRQRRHRETWEGIAAGLPDAPAPRALPGLDEFDADDLLAASGAPPPMPGDASAFFRSLRAAVLAWQRGEIDGARESWTAFSARVAEALREVAAAAPALVVSSGGAIGLMVATVLRSPPDRMIELQLQLRNCAVTRLVAGRREVVLHSFNELPHAAGAPELVTYA